MYEVCREGAGLALTYNVLVGITPAAHWRFGDRRYKFPELFTGQVQHAPLHIFREGWQACWSVMGRWTLGMRVACMYGLQEKWRGGLGFTSGSGTISQMTTNYHFHSQVTSCPYVNRGWDEKSLRFPSINMVHLRDMVNFWVSSLTFLRVYTCISEKTKEAW